MWKNNIILKKKSTTQEMKTLEDSDLDQRANKGMMIALMKEDIPVEKGAEIETDIKVLTTNRETRAENIAGTGAEKEEINCLTNQLIWYIKKQEMMLKLKPMKIFFIKRCCGPVGQTVD